MPKTTTDPIPPEALAAFELLYGDSARFAWLCRGAEDAEPGGQRPSRSMRWRRVLKLIETGVLPRDAVDQARAEFAKPLPDETA